LKFVFSGHRAVGGFVGGMDGDRSGLDRPTSAI